MLKFGNLPRYYQLREVLREQILSGQWNADKRLPSERELSEQYGLSRMMVRQSVSELVKEGLLYREQGKGTFVARPKITQQLLRLTGFTEDIRARSQKPTTKVLSAEMWPADPNAAIDAVTAQAVQSEMMTNVTTGNMTPEQAVEDAHNKIVSIFEEFGLPQG